MSDRREKEKQEARYTSAKAWADQQSGGFEPTAIKKPAGLENYKLDKEGAHLFDIIPYIVGKGNKAADPGFAHFERSYDVHKIPRPDGGTDWYCCLWACWKEPCPVCSIRKSMGKEEGDALRPQLRRLFLVNDKPGKLKNPLKLLDEVHYNRGLGFGEQLLTAMQATRGGVDLHRLSGGKTVQVMVGNAKYRQCTRIDLMDRSYDYPEDWLDKSPCLDDFLIKPSVKMLNSLLEQFGATPPDDDDAPSDDVPRRTTVAVTDPRDAKSRAEPEDDDEDAAPPRAAAKSKAPAQDDDDEDAAPPAKAAPAKVKATPPPADDDEDEDAPAPAPKKAAAPAATKEPTAKDMGLSVGMSGHYKGLEVTITKISADGTSITMKDDDDEEEYVNIAPSKFKPSKAAAAPAASTKKTPPKVDPEDEDLDDDDD